MITINSKDFYNAFKQVKRTDVHAFPILNHALIQLTDEGMVIKSTDGESLLSAMTHYWGNGERWETCVLLVHVVPTTPGGRIGPKRKFYPFLDYLRVMAEFNEVLTLEYNSAIETLTVRADGSTSKFKCMNSQEFPLVGA